MTIDNHIKNSNFIYGRCLVKKDPIGFAVMMILAIIGLAFLLDWKSVANFGNTPPAPAYKKEPLRQHQGFGPQCDFDDPVTPCAHRAVVKEVPQ